jgi:hypothetical protein
MEPKKLFDLGGGIISNVIHIVYLAMLDMNQFQMGMKAEGDKKLLETKAEKNMIAINNRISGTQGLTIGVIGMLVLMARKCGNK